MAMKLWYVDGYYDDFLAKIKRKEAIELGEEIDEEWPYPVYLAADVKRMKARVHHSAPNGLRDKIAKMIHVQQDTCYPSVLDLADRILALFRPEPGKLSEWLEKRKAFVDGAKYGAQEYEDNEIFFVHWAEDEAARRYSISSAPRDESKEGEVSDVKTWCPTCGQPVKAEKLKAWRGKARCKVCHKTFKTIRGVLLHIHAKHPEEKELVNIRSMKVGTVAKW